MTGALEDAEDYKAFEAALTADYDAQSAVERELVLRLASLLWRLRRVTTIETGLFEVEAEQLYGHRQSRRLQPASRYVVQALFEGSIQSPLTDATTSVTDPVLTGLNPKATFGADFARCFLRLADLPNFALDRLGRYEITPLASGGSASLRPRCLGSSESARTTPVNLKMHDPLIAAVATSICPNDWP